MHSAPASTAAWTDAVPPSMVFCSDGHAGRIGDSVPVLPGDLSFLTCRHLPAPVVLACFLLLHSVPAGGAVLDAGGGGHVVLTASTWGCPSARGRYRGGPSVGLTSTRCAVAPRRPARHRQHVGRVDSSSVRTPPTRPRVLYTAPPRRRHRDGGSGGAATAAVAGPPVPRPPVAVVDLRCRCHNSGAAPSVVLSHAAAPTRRGRTRCSTRTTISSPEPNRKRATAALSSAPSHQPLGAAPPPLSPPPTHPPAPPPDPLLSYSPHPSHASPAHNSPPTLPPVSVPPAAAPPRRCARPNP